MRKIAKCMSIVLTVLALIINLSGCPTEGGDNWDDIEEHDETAILRLTFVNEADVDLNIEEIKDDIAPSIEEGFVVESGKSSDSVDLNCTVHINAGEALVIYNPYPFVKAHWGTDGIVYIYESSSGTPSEFGISSLKADGNGRIRFRERLNLAEEGGSVTSVTIYFRKLIVEGDPSTTYYYFSTVEN